MKSAIRQTISVIIYIGAILMGIYELGHYDGSRSTFFGILSIIYGVGSLAFFISEYLQQKKSQD